MRTRISTDKVQMFSYFIVLSLLGSLLLSLPQAYNTRVPAPYVDALFTSVSAVCVTGLSTLNMDVYTPAGFFIIMFLIEFGGLGIISFIALYIAVPQRKVSLVNRTVIRDFFIDDVETEPRKILKSILVFTLLIQILSAVVLFFAFRDEGSVKPVLDALFHSVSAFCNAGFSTYNDSLVGFRSNRVIVITIMFLIVAGGIGFMVLTDIFNSLFLRKKKMSFHSRIVLLVTFLLIVIAAAIFFIFEGNNAMKGLSLTDKVLASLFQSITPRTAGFEVISQKAYFPITKLVTTVLMFVGGSPGSIAGGVKTTTFLVVFLYAIRGNTERDGMNMHKRNIDTAVIEKAFSIVAKSLMIIVLSLSFLLVTEQTALAENSCSVFELLFEVVSAFATVGLSLGVTANLTFWGKIVIIATMFVGRTGIFAMALGFARYEKEKFFEYPSASIMVG